MLRPSDKQPRLPDESVMDGIVTTAQPALYVQIHSCTDSEREVQDLVLIHGWGMHSGIWGSLVQCLIRYYRVTTVDLPGFGQSRNVRHDFEIESLLRKLNSILPESCLLAGWSLGGNLATLLAHRYPQKVRALVTIASNPKFLASDDWPHAMAPQVFFQFAYGFDLDPQATLKRFVSLLAAGDGQEKIRRRQLQSFVTEMSESNQSSISSALNLLVSLDTRTCLQELQQPVLHVLGSNDALVPAKIAEHLITLNGAHLIRLLSGVSHAPMLANADGLAAILQDFFSGRSSSKSGQVSAIEKKQVADSFSRSANTYDEVASLQRSVGERLLDGLADPSLNEYRSRSETVLDIGSGTAHFSKRLHEYFPGARVIGLDIAPGMLSYSRLHSGQASADWLCADAEFLPLVENSIDFIFSNLTIQWCEQPQRLMQEIQRVLKPGGMFLFSTLGPDTLWELRLAWNRVDSHVHVNSFATLPVLQQAMERAGLQHSSLHTEYQINLYPTLDKLTYELKALGAHNVNNGRPMGLTGCERIRRFKQGYELLKNQGGQLPATWQVIIGTARKSAEQANTANTASSSHD